MDTIDIPDEKEFCILYMPSAFKMEGDTSLTPAPQKKGWNGYILSQGVYRIIYIDKGLEQLASLARSKTPLRDTNTVISTGLNGDIVVGSM
jgi:hypothetical protein